VFSVPGGGLTLVPNHTSGGLHLRAGNGGGHVDGEVGNGIVLGKGGARVAFCDVA
jgi:hypothetical protein